MMKIIIVLLCFIGFISMPLSAFSAPQEKQRTIPDLNTIENIGYLSTIYLINPCYEGDDYFPEESKEASQEARKEYPAHACDNPILREKIYKTSFLQYTLLTMVKDPWNLDNEIDKQNKDIKNCKDLTCLDKTLDRIIAELSPLYFSIPENADAQRQPFCLGDIDYTHNKDMKKSVDSILQKLSAKTDDGNTCFEEGIITKENNPIFNNSEKLMTSEGVRFEVCKTNIGTVFYGECAMYGNQVNTLTWTYLLQPVKSHQTKNPSLKPQEIFFSGDGPISETNKSCNGMPILVTNARYSMVEHLITYYYYDSAQYKNVYSHKDTWVGQDQNGNDISIAMDVKKAKTPVYCREEK